MIETFPTVTEFFVIPVVEFNSLDVGVCAAAQDEPLDEAAPATPAEVTTSPPATMARLASTALARRIRLPDECICITLPLV
jgi:hypothetical protein